MKKQKRGLLRATRRFMGALDSSLPWVMTYARAAKELGITEKRVRQLVKLRRIDTVQVKGKRKITDRALRRALL